jgi:excisionase family DNA binding protein
LATSVANAALSIGVSKGTIRSAIRENKLQSHLIGRRRVIFIEDLLSWIRKGSEHV